MKLKNEQIFQYVQALEQFGKATGFPGMIIAITHGRLVRKIEGYLKEKQRIFETYGNQEHGEWFIPITLPNYEEIVKRLQEIGNAEEDVEIPNFSEYEFIEKFQNDALNAENYNVLYSIFVRKEAK